ncbi:hypothetical protein JTE90_009193 [Oedothorax gibbosus]|uniref:Circadian locomoter output cycles protein kaput n=1 Tax=Oedothorax gibbosus TaxID=931172 RepID=A0AAV6UXC0_9ARAC|nr:hypothetical protein JTE90_009193 [Oedothorax gibbosus]
MHKSRNLSEKKRRDQFNILINELCSMVTSSNRKIDKSSVLRSTISFLRNHSELSLQSQSVKVPENWKPSFLSNEEFTHLMLEALDGFIIVFSCNGQILYTSESTSSLLGYLPTRIYSSVFDIIHDMDKSSLYKLISNPPSSNNSMSKDSFVNISLHMKRGPIHPQGSNTYELVQLLGSFYHWPSSCEASQVDCGDSNSCSSICSMPSGAAELRSCFVAVGRLHTPHLLRAVNLPDDAKNEFTSRHSLEWKFLFLDHRAPPIIGYLPFEVLGTSGYDYYHVDDLDNIAASHELLMTTGEGTSCYYRFLTKGQQWIWLQTRFYISYHQWNSKPEFIVCTHTVVSTEKVLRSHQDSSQCTSPRKPRRSTRCSSPLSPSLSISSLGSLSSDPPTEQIPIVSAPPNPRATTVFPSPSRDVFPRSYPTAVQDQFVEPQQKVFNRTPTKQDLHVSPTSVQPGTSAMRMNPDIPMQQFQGEQRSPPVNPVQMNPDYLRHRHRLLQQQIMAQQEELRRVSEQLLMVEYGGNTGQEMCPNPTGASSGILYQNMGAQGRYVEPQYQRVATSTESVMRSRDNFTVNTTTLGEDSRTYINLETGMCSIPQEQMTQQSQQGGANAQGYSMNHHLRHPDT